MTRCPYPVPRHRNFHGTSVIPKISPISSLSHLFALRLLIFTWRVHLHPITPTKKIKNKKRTYQKKNYQNKKQGKIFLYDLPIFKTKYNESPYTQPNPPTHPTPKKASSPLRSKLRLLYNWSVPRFLRQLNGSLDEDDSTSWTTPGRNWPLVTPMGRSHRSHTVDGNQKSSDFVTRWGKGSWNLPFFTKVLRTIQTVVCLGFLNHQQ